MFRIKICGITNVEDAVAVAEAGADAVGLNFYGGSKRYVTPAEAQMIVFGLPPGIAKVGLFVNADAADICGIFDRLGLDLIQLHGDEPSEFLVELGNRPVMRAFRLGPGNLYPVGEFLRGCQGLECMPRMVLGDAQVEGAYGGTGQTADWEVLKNYRQMTPIEALPPLVLAGGLTPENVAEAIRTVRPAAVDTASGVESSPGRKDPAKLEAFVRAAREAFEEIA